MVSTLADSGVVGNCFVSHSFQIYLGSGVARLTAALALGSVLYIDSTLTTDPSFLNQLLSVTFTWVVYTTEIQEGGHGV